MALLLLATALLGTAPALAEDWALVAESGNGVIISLDRDSVRDKGDYRQAWTRHDYSKLPDEEVSVRNALEDYDCGGRRMRLRSTVAYGRDGAVLRTSKFAERQVPWKVVDQGSMGEAKLDAVCAAEIKG